ncbi:hypothetical protein A3K29_04365 [Candidatus Collierbacteria bacterium RIFOXYB2_FULL_46_14]|nr:MAG: hypothetical protein A3K29_04365 [Candidatus Collierbacteria bacterium RIFOXYB2_FULL_46_14]OGD76377.1 MAG: hypothetical protein A3K43_04365 [Candidatus Collierbacteria bacterium RIFOXYA2_FULL_46_20]OGD77713.1 MAG: hypothetical protein A3K39_04365 [Candidatus Collierbacteria bacterium RIFOXYC2_FULL_43_15]OGD81003.1 MAG: hypothetical protein A2320_04860 [Pseudomonadales bacterium GWC2_63_15]OGD82435.1 MAG: hypothetical protein A3K36_04365 [Candidatus Collierbacteria bacterium RIFOXYD2_FUL
MSLLPKFVTRFFWGDNTKDLSLSKHGKYISQTLMDKGDLPSIKWLLKKKSKKQLKKNISPKMNKKARNFWKIYLG